MSSMFPPIDDDIEVHDSIPNKPNDNDNDDGTGTAIDMFSLLQDVSLPDGVTLEQFQQAFLQILAKPSGRKKLSNINTIEQVVDLIESCSNILVLSGAGISVSAGIPDFRSENGLYKQLKERFNLNDPTAMFDQNYFLEDPSLFYSFGGDICPGFDGDAIQYYPTPTHYFIKMLETKGKLLRNYTQNIDTLEMRAGIENVITCHGSYRTASCTNCEWQIHGAEIQRHIFNQKVPFCPYCCPQKSDLKALQMMESTKSSKYRTRKEVRTECPSGKLLYFRIPKLLCSMKHLFTACPVIFSFDQSVLRKTIFDDDEMNRIHRDNNDDNGDEAKNENENEDEDEGNSNFKILVLWSLNPSVLRVCNDAIMGWLQSLPSWGAMKPDIVFFSEALSSDYHETLEQDVKECDLLLILGTSLQVAPVNRIPEMVESNVPVILINREKVGYPNEFDVNLLGNCDDVCCTLIEKLKWKWMKPIKQKSNTNSKNPQDKSAQHKIKPIDTEPCEVEAVEYRCVPPCYYLFPNGTLPEDVAAR